MAVQGSKRSHHLAAVIRADQVVERSPGGTRGHEGGGAVVENQAAVGNWTPAGRARAAAGHDSDEVSIGVGFGIRAALPLWWRAENHLAAFAVVLASSPGFWKLRS